MTLPRATTALRASLRAAPRLPTHKQAVRCLSASAPRRIAMADGGRAADDIDLAFDYPSEMQQTYTTPAGYHQARVDKEMGYPDQRVLYALVSGIGLIALYGGIKSTMYEGERVAPQLTATAAPIEPKEYMSANRDKTVHLPSRKPTDNKMERFIGRGG
ncbi:hypothetical protein B0T16DRAFT_202147 [Cercophora newfieldiana]|uniref:Uncharacterized protein n=1 Tax=Cercophora newfieldiana TaxID=92897 RepID=A0AA39XWA5_9PEZI|nr:hypothetical protein B0T16DRAFT_202147 [Cercophora newfieldiana]